MIKPKHEVHTLDELYQDFRDHRPMAPNTGLNYRKTMKEFKKFLLKEVGTENPTLDVFDVRLLTRFALALQQSGKAYQYRVNILCRVKAPFHHGKRMKLLKDYPFDDYTDPNEVIRHGANQLDRVLSKDHLGILENTQVGAKNLELTRLHFLFQRWTGMSWADMNHYGNRIMECLRTDLKGRSVLQYNRVKTGETAIVPLFPQTKELLKKLGDRIYPGIYITYYKRMISLFEYLNIPIRDAGAHMGRHVFGSEMLEAGFTMEAVSRMMGHASVKETEDTYARINADKIFADASKIKEFHDVFERLPGLPPIDVPPLKPENE